ncbi:MAG: GAF domain-containing protein [Chloroflexota bacterium]
MVGSGKDKLVSTQASLDLLYRISFEIAATLDLSEVLQRVLFLAMDNIKATSGSIIVMNKKGEPIESALVNNGIILDHSTEQLSQIIRQGLAGWVIKNRQAVHVPDTRQEERWFQKDTTRSTQSSLCAPFIAHDHLVGVITLSHAIPHFFTEEHFNLIQTIANQTAIAVLNARIHSASQRQVQVMSTLAKSATAISASLNLSNVLEQILEQTSQVLDVDIASLALLDAERENLEFIASTAPKEFSSVGIKHSIGKGIAGWVAINNQSVIVPDAYQDTRFYQDIDKNIGYRTKALACAPIRVGGEIIGVLEAINPRDGVFAVDALMILNGVASLAGTAIRHAQLFEELQTAHKRYHDLYDNNINAMLITNWDGDIIEANHQASVLSGCSKEILHQKQIYDLHHLDKDLSVNYLERIAAEETISYESILKTLDNTEIPIQVHAHMVKIDGRDHLYWTFQDISARVEIDQLREDLLSMVYHDLRSPLSNVISSLNVLENMEAYQDEHNIRTLLNIAVRSTDRIQRLTSSLLDINRLEAGQPVANISLTNPHDLIEASIDAILPMTNSKNQKIIFDIPDHLPEIEIDENMIQRVLINFLENATKYSPPGEKISIGARTEGENITFWVEDSGPGIPEGKHKQIFEKYIRLHGGAKISGIGLGLAYCRLAVEGHHGHTWAEPASQTGARFAFTIPIKHQHIS